MRGPLENPYDEGYCGVFDDVNFKAEEEAERREAQEVGKMDKPCELCHTPAPKITSGPFAGSAGMHDYCMYCSRDLCDACFSKSCKESPTGKHEKEPES